MANLPVLPISNKNKFFLKNPSIFSEKAQNVNVLRKVIFQPRQYWQARQSWQSWHNWHIWIFWHL